MRPRLLGMIECAIASVGGPATAVPRDPKAAAYLDNALSLLRTKHINRANVDWPGIEATARTQIRDARTTADTYPAIRAVLDTLGEKHSFLAEPRLPTDAGPAPGNQSGGSTERQPVLPKGVVVRGSIGAISLPSLNTLGTGGKGDGAAYTARLRSELRRTDGAAKCVWFVDLRQNGGGNMWPMLRGLDPLLGDAPFGHFVVGHGATQPWVRTTEGIAPSPDRTSSASTSSTVKPGFTLEHARAPVAVMIGPQTSSSGEMVAIALSGRPNTRTFGARTAGFSTANQSYPLGDGAMLAITVMTVRDRLGRDYRGPIEPDEEAMGDAADMAAIRWLETSCQRAD